MKFPEREGIDARALNINIVKTFERDFIPDMNRKAVKKPAGER